MTVRTWDPFREMDVLRREIDQMFNGNGEGIWRRPYSRVSFLPGLSRHEYPLINLNEDHDNFYLEALSPGLDPEALEITVVRDELRISGQKSAIKQDIKPQSFHRNERAAGRFVRTFTLPTDVNRDKVTAEYTNGLLRITLPKSEEAKPRSIELKVD